MDLERFHQQLDATRGYSLNLAQRRAVDHSTGPLWLLAGPGSGKTEVLVGRVLKLICVEEVPPRSILLTTFTKKASRNLEDRIFQSFLGLAEAETTLRQVDFSDLRIGTLHALCNDILQEYRFPAYRNVRLLDEVEQALFLYRYANISEHAEIDFWSFFSYAVPRWSPGNPGYPPGKWKRASAAAVLFNHLTEDLVLRERLTAAGGHWASLIGFHSQYQEALATSYRCDFAQLQQHFLSFLRHRLGTSFLDGDDVRPPLQYVLVDEYQDTNPIQERIYLALAQRLPHNITVVGDDDQALYRFRGATVSAMVYFDQACVSALGPEPRRIQLSLNYRSHPEIVEFFNTYIASFPEMQEPGVRAPGKEPVEPAREFPQGYSAVGRLQGRTVADLGQNFARFIQDHLLGDGVIGDLSQCALLLRSPKDSPNNAGPFLRALESLNIPVYNPRSKTFLESEEVQALLAAVVLILDPSFTFRQNQLRDLANRVNGWLITLEAVETSGVDLTQVRSYIERSVDSLTQRCQAQPGQFLHTSILEIVYRILSREPFCAWREDPERNARLSKVTRLLDGYHSMGLDHLKAADEGTGLSGGFVARFFYMMVGYLIDADISEDEDEDVVVPHGRLPVMSIHQAKGLEFPFVFVGQLGQEGSVGAAQILDEVLRPFRDTLHSSHESAPDELLFEDNVRQWYVAYSRAQYGLVLLATTNQLRNSVAVPARDAQSFRNNTHIFMP